MSYVHHLSTNKAKKLRGHFAPNSSTETYPICADPSLRADEILVIVCTQAMPIQAISRSARPNFAPLQKLRLNCVLMCEQKRNPIWRRKEQSWETCMVNSRGTRSLLRLTTKTTLPSRPLFFTLFALTFNKTSYRHVSIGLLRSRSWERQWHARLGSLLFYDWFSKGNK